MRRFDPIPPDVSPEKFIEIMEDRYRKNVADVTDEYLRRWHSDWLMVYRQRLTREEDLY